LFAPLPDAFPAADLVVVWGEGFDFARIPGNARTILLGSYEQAENAQVDVFIPISVQTERRGRYTNFAGVTSAFEPCFAKKPSVADAEALFAAWTEKVEVGA
jgi:NADH-quinone oxidoreductase subunit G